MPELIPFDYAHYFYSDIDNRTEHQLPSVKLNKKGIRLIAQYYSDKYQLPKELIILERLSQICERIPPKTEHEIRTPYLICSAAPLDQNPEESGHSTPAVYIKEGTLEAILVLDTASIIGGIHILSESTSLQIYTITTSRQIDFYSCHTDALVILRELVGKNQNGNFFIPNLLSRLIAENRIEKWALYKNISEIKYLFNRLLITTQEPDFLKLKKDGHEVAHIHNGVAENLDTFFKRYPSDEASKSRKPLASNYLREKGLKFAHIIEIQFYINQLKNILAAHFTDQLRLDFIHAAKIELKTHGKLSFLTPVGKISLLKLAQKFLSQKSESYEAQVTAALARTKL